MNVTPTPGTVSWRHRLELAALELVARHAASFSATRRRHTAGLLTWLALDGLRIRADYVYDVLRSRLGLDDTVARRLRRRVYTSFFENCLEAVTLPALSAAELTARIHVTGLAHLQNALALGHGAIITSGHYGCWELVPSWLDRQGFPVTIVVRRQNNAQVDAFMERMRQAHGPRTVDSGFGLREILRSLKQGRILALMVDQDAGDKGLAVDFLGRPASTVAGPSHIALKSGAPIVPLTLHRQHGGPHHLEILPPLYPREYAEHHHDQAAWVMTQAFTDALAERVRRRPDQWFWLHRRWKHGHIAKAAPTRDGRTDSMVDHSS